MTVLLLNDSDGMRERGREMKPSGPLPLITAEYHLILTSIS